MYVFWDFSYTLRNLVPDLPSVVFNGDDFFFFYHPMTSVISKFQNYVPYSKQHTEHLVKNGRENPKIFKKYIYILELAFSYFSLF